MAPIYLHIEEMKLEDGEIIKDANACIIGCFVIIDADPTPILYSESSISYLKGNTRSNQNNQRNQPRFIRFF